MIINHQKILACFGLVFEAAVAYLSRESWQLWSGVFCAVGWCSRRALGDSTRNINTNWKTCEIQVERFWECSTSVFILLFTFVLFSLWIQQALYFSLILSRCQFLFRSKCYDIVYYNCKLQLWTFKAGSKNIYGLFYKIHFIHTFK